jgi:hypothetical protein
MSVYGAGFWVWGLRFRDKVVGIGLDWMVQGFEGSGFRVQGSGFRVQGLRLKDKPQTPNPKP